MSRTYRCKNVKAPKAYFYTEEEFDRAMSNSRLRYRYRGNHFVSYEKYLAFENAKQHADGYFRCYVHGSVPSHVNNWYYERPLRREVKREIHHSLRNDGGDNLVHRTPKHMKCSRYWYW